MFQARPVKDPGTLADLWGVILRRACNGKKALPLLQILFSCLHWLHDSGWESILPPSRVNAVAETVAAPGKGYRAIGGISQVVTDG
jgi:hypothetical protein